MDQLFFELIRVAIGNAVCLSHTPTAKEWQMLYEMAKKQSLVGICFAGVQRLQAQRQAPNSWGNEQGEMLYLQWMGMAAKIQQRNEVLNRQCAELAESLKLRGYRSSILKGQGFATLYKVRAERLELRDSDSEFDNNSKLSSLSSHLGLLRQSGDIDIYVDCGREKAIEYARSMQDEVVWDYKHLHLKMFKDTEVEMHYRPEILMNLRKNARLQRWFEQPEVQSSMFQTTGGLVAPSVEFNLFYILLHIYRHFLFEGVGMRQLMDYYFVLRTQISDKRLEINDDLLRLLKEFGMERFAKGIMWIMKTVFAGHDNDDDNDNFFLGIKPDEKEGRYILREVMEGGNFGHHDERNMVNVSGKKGSVLRILRHNWHLLAHYPSEALWAPIYFVWHKLWKMIND